MNERTQYTLYLVRWTNEHFRVLWAGTDIGSITCTSTGLYGAMLGHVYLDGVNTFHEAFDLVMSAHQAELAAVEQALFEEEAFDALAYAAARLRLEYVPMSGTSEDDAETELDSMVKRLCQRLAKLSPTELAEYMHHDAHTQEVNG